jgi:hypothetical protein
MTSEQEMTSFLAGADDLVTEYVKLLAADPISTPWITRYLLRDVQSIATDEHRCVALATMLATALQRLAVT